GQGGQATKEEGLALEVILDPAARVVVRDVAARLAPLDREERAGPDRHPPPLAEGARRFDAVGDAVPLTLDGRLIAAAWPVDGLYERALDAVGQHAVQKPDIDPKGGPVRLNRGGEGPLQAQRSQEESQGQCQKLSTVDGLPGHGAVGSPILAISMQELVRQPVLL